MNNSVSNSNSPKKESSVGDWILNITILAIVVFCLYIGIDSYIKTHFGNQTQTEQVVTTAKE